MSPEWILANRLVLLFKQGILPLEPGSSLSKFLAKLLNRFATGARVPLKAMTTNFLNENHPLGRGRFSRREEPTATITAAKRTLQDQVAAFVESQRDRQPAHGSKYLGVTSTNSETNGSTTLPWKAQASIPKEHLEQGVCKTAHIGTFVTQLEAACAFDAFIKEDKRWPEAYVTEKSNCIKFAGDFEPMTAQMKAAAEKGRDEAIKQAQPVAAGPAAAPAPSPLNALGAGAPAPATAIPGAAGVQTPAAGAPAVAPKVLMIKLKLAGCPVLVRPMSAAHLTAQAPAPAPAALGDGEMDTT